LHKKHKKQPPNQKVVPPVAPFFLTRSKLQHFSNMAFRTHTVAQKNLKINNKIKKWCYLKKNVFFLNIQIIVFYDLIELVALTTKPYTNKQSKIEPQMVTCKFIYNFLGELIYTKK
jgi:hypothetical protein